MRLDPWEVRGPEHLPVVQFLMPNNSVLGCGGEHAALFFRHLRMAWMAAT